MADEKPTEKDVRLWTTHGDHVSPALRDYEWKFVGETGRLFIDNVLTNNGPGKVFVGIRLPRVKK